MVVPALTGSRSAVSVPPMGAAGIGLAGGEEEGDPGQRQDRRGERVRLPPVDDGVDDPSEQRVAVGGAQTGTSLFMIENTALATALPDAGAGADLPVHVQVPGRPETAHEPLIGPLADVVPAAAAAELADRLRSVLQDLVGS